MQSGLTFYVGISATIIILFLGRHVIHGTIKNLIETIQYIRKNGWEEYWKARERFDRHMELQNRGEAKYSKVGEIRQRKAAKKKAKR